MHELSLIIVADEVDAEAAEVFVDGAVAGRPYRFLLDTGAARTSVQFDAHTARFARVGTKHSAGVFARSSDDLVAAPSIAVGPMAWQDVTVARSAEGSAFTKNLIGMDLLRELRCAFRFDVGQLLVDAPVDGVPEAALQPLRFDAASHPYVDVGIGAVAAQAVWDTGAGITVVDTSFIERNPEQFTVAGRSAGTDSTGATLETAMYRMGPALIGGALFPPHTVAAVDLSAVNAAIEIPMDLILGYSTLGQAHWLFDFPRGRWAVTKLLTRDQP